MKCLVCIVGIALLAMAGTCFAGPAPISSALFVNPMPAGPAQDAMAVKGQWFYDTTSGLVHAQDWEYHDDDVTMSINGIVQSITFDGSPASNIVAFTVLATVINNLPSQFQTGVASNSHLEVQGPVGANYAGILRQARISAEFAIANTNNNTIALQWNGQSPVVYEPQYAEALSTNTVWTPCGGYVSAPPYMHGETMTTQRFFRVKTPYTMP